MTMRFKKTALCLAMMAASGAAIAANSTITFHANGELVTDGSVHEGDEVIVTVTYGGDYGAITGTGLLKNDVVAALNEDAAFTDNTVAHRYTAGSSGSTDNFQATIFTQGSANGNNDEVSGSLRIVNHAPAITSVEVEAGGTTEAFAGVPIVLEAVVGDIDAPSTSLEFIWAIAPVSGDNTAPLLEGTSGTTYTKTENWADTDSSVTSALEVGVPDTLTQDTTYNVLLTVKDTNNPAATASTVWSGELSLLFKPQTKMEAKFIIKNEALSPNVIVEDGDTIYLDSDLVTPLKVGKLYDDGSGDADAISPAYEYDWAITGAGCSFNDLGTSFSSHDSTPELANEPFSVPSQQVAVGTSCTFELVATNDPSGINESSDPVTKTIHFAAYTQPTVKVLDADGNDVSDSNIVLKPDEALSLTAVASDIDDEGASGSFTYLWSGDGSGGNASVNDDSLAPGIHTYTVVVTDDDVLKTIPVSNSVSEPVTVTVEVLVEANVATASFQPTSPTNGVYTEDQYITVKSDWPVTGTTCTDITHEWSVDPDLTVTESPFNIENSGSYQFKARVASNSNGAEDFTVTQTVTDNCTGLTATYEHEPFSINDAINGDPTAAATVSVNPVIVGEVFELSGSNSSDPDGKSDIRGGYSWSQLTGDTIDIDDPTEDEIELTAPEEAGTYTFSLQVTDLSGKTNSEIIRVIVSESPNQAPTALAAFGSDLPSDGAFDLNTAGQTVTFEASGSSDPDGDELEYSWELTNPPTTRDSFSSDSADFNYEIPDTISESTALEFVLTVTDEEGLTDTDTLYINVGGSEAPAAIATYRHINGGTAIQEGDTVILDGAGSTVVSGGSLSYLWTQTSGPAVKLSSANPANGKATFVVPRISEDQSIGMLLEVTDSNGFKDAYKLSIAVADNGLQVDSEFIPAVPLLYGTHESDVSGAGFAVSGGQLIALRQVKQSEYSGAKSVPSGLAYGVWEFFIKPSAGNGGSATLKMTTIPSSGSTIAPYRFDPNANTFALFADETDVSGTSLFIDDSSTIQVQVKDGGSTDDGATNGLIRGMIAFADETYTANETTSGSSTTLGGGAIGAGGLLALAGLAGFRRRRAS